MKCETELKIQTPGNNDLLDYSSSCPDLRMYEVRSKSFLLVLPSPDPYICVYPISMPNSLMGPMSRHPSLGDQTFNGKVVDFSFLSTQTVQEQRENRNITGKSGNQTHQDTRK